MSDFDPRLKEFVDRKAEVARFERFFSDPNKIGLAVIGPEGRGKSMLRVKLAKKCLDDRLAYSVLVSTSDDIHDFMTILRSCCEKLGETQFPRFVAALNAPATTPIDVNLRADGNFRILENAQIPGSVRDVTGLAVNNPQFAFALAT